MDAASVRKTARLTRAKFFALSSLALLAYKFPRHVDVPNNAEYNYIVVGAGTGGCILAHRLSEDPKVNVLLIEEGNDPQLETELLGLFPYVENSVMDRNYTSENDGYTAQYHRNKRVNLPAGIVLGGSGCLDHLYYVRGHPYDYELWAQAAGDDSWTWWNLLPYFMKSERLEDPDILNSETSKFHGKNGLVGITRETRIETLKYLEAFQEVGHQIKDDICTNDPLGYARPLFAVSNGVRQSTAESFLPTAKNRPNLHVMKGTTVTKVLFDECMNAVGVECRKSNGKVINVYARNEVILSAGAFGTPKLLMLSGVGPKEHLNSMGIKVLYDSPNVGKNLKDHLGIVLTHKLEKTDDVVQPPDPHFFPVPTFLGLCNIQQNYTEYITINLICRNNPTALLQLSSVVFGLHDDVCNHLATVGTGREVLFTVLNLARPLSSGTVLLRSSNPADPPKIFIGHLSNKSDLENNVEYIKDFIRVKMSSYFKSVGGELIYFDLPRCRGLKRGTDNYWKCYILNMMDTTFHYSGSCRMGSVLDSRLRVIGTQRLRVGDASAMPNQIAGKINPAVMVIAEKLADMIKEDNN